MAPVLVPGGVAFCGLLGAGPAFGRDRVQKLRQTATSRGKRTQNAHRSAGKAAAGSVADDPRRPRGIPLTAGPEPTATLIIVPTGVRRLAAEFEAYPNGLSFTPRRRLS